MIFNKHSELEGRHAFLSASKYHWVGYDEEKLARVYRSARASYEGSQLHELAYMLIKTGQKLPRTSKTLNMYVNDAIGFGMTPELVLCYSQNAFGTADAISFKNEKLRIHDLKTGTTRASMRQLEVYTAFFCLEYEVRPGEIQIENRIYQNDDVQIHIPELDDIVHIMSQVKTFDRLINEIREKELA